MSIEVMKQALEALENALSDDKPYIRKSRDAIPALRAAIEQAEKQEPVATLWQHGETGRTRITMPGDITDCDARWFKAADLYTAPPAAQRQPLTEQEIAEIMDYGQYDRRVPEYAKNFVRAIEAAHGIGGEHD